MHSLGTLSSFVLTKSSGASHISARSPPPPPAFRRKLAPVQRILRTIDQRPARWKSVRVPEESLRDEVNSVSRAAAGNRTKKLPKNDRRPLSLSLSLPPSLGWKTRKHSLTCSTSIRRVRCPFRPAARAFPARDKTTVFNPSLLAGFLSALGASSQTSSLRCTTRKSFLEDSKLRTKLQNLLEETGFNITRIPRAEQVASPSRNCYFPGCIL